MAPRVLDKTRFMAFSQDVIKRARIGFQNFEGALIVMASSDPEDEELLDTHLALVCKDEAVRISIADRIASLIVGNVGEEHRERLVAEALVGLRGDNRINKALYAFGPTAIGDDSAIVALTARHLILMIDTRVSEAREDAEAIRYEMSFESDTESEFLDEVSREVVRAYQHAGWIVQSDLQETTLTFELRKPQGGES